MHALMQVSEAAHVAALAAAEHAQRTGEDLRREYEGRLAQARERADVSCLAMQRSLLRRCRSGGCLWWLPLSGLWWLRWVVRRRDV